MSLFDGDIESIDEKKLDKTLEILKKYELNENDTLKKIVKKIFDSNNTDVLNCDKKHIYTYVLELPIRNLAKKNKDKKYDTYRNYIELLSSLMGFNESIKKY